MIAREITHDSIINDTINLSEMAHREREHDVRVYWSSCRCGGTYEIEDEDLKGCGQDGRGLEGCDLIVGCSTCSLHIKITS